MGALAPVSPWFPEDDLLLKNAIEAGASLESLAKGAVQFSRKYTVRELQDRWHSLLYDPVISAAASFRMIEFERSGSTHPSKFSRAGISTENKSLSAKRKVESVRSCYYSLRKRIRNEPFNSMDLSFLVAPSNDSFFGNGDEHLSGNCMLGDPMSNHFGLESNLDIMHHAFPQISADGGTAISNGHLAHGFHSGLDHPVEEDYPMDQDTIHHGIPHIFEEDQSFTGNGSGVEELGQSKQVPSLFEADNLQANPPSTYDQINNDPGNVCSTFEGNHVFHSPIPECDASFQNMEYSSPLPEMPIWRTVEDISSPAIQVDDCLREKDIHTGDTFALPDDDDAKDTSATGCDFVDVNSNLKMQMSCDGLKSPSDSTEGYLAELSNSLLNFTNDDELLFMDDDGKEMIDKSYYDGLSSLLLSSPNDVNQDHMPGPESEISLTPDCLANVPVTSPVQSVEKVQMQSSAPASDPRFPELKDGVICCTLNTEDTEIPCNDDVFLLTKLNQSISIGTRRNVKETGNPISSSIKGLSGNQKVGEGGPVLMHIDQEKPGQCKASSHMMGSQMPQKGQLHPVSDSGVNHELPNCEQQVACRTQGTASGDSSKINAVNISTENLQPARAKEEKKETGLVKDLGHTLTVSLKQKPSFASDGCRERSTSGTKQEFDVPTIQDCQASNAEVGSINIPDPESVLNPPTSELEELLVESDDDDVPYFSDIEAMILDMELDPEDEDLYEQEVSKYQHDDSKRTLMRLEQGAHSYMQRTIASHGAFAILYGRHSRHYIKKPEVLLGRATDDSVVDIDLGREGSASKISRRQAIINMEKDGSFSLKNLGKSSILVNNKEVGVGQSLSLNSSCLIEIREMSFIFEANQTRVKRYLDSIAKKDQVMSTTLS